MLEKYQYVINDHVAFRTFNLAPVNLANLEPLFLDLGYKIFETYHFKQKKLDAISYIHQDLNQPKIFIS